MMSLLQIDYLTILKQKIIYMKNLLKTFIGVFVLSTLIISCSNDDDMGSDSNKNYIKVGETVYELSTGAMENFGKYDNGIDKYDGYNICLTLVSKGVSLSGDEDGEMVITGSGQIFYFDMYTSKGSSFDDRDYNFDGIPPTQIGTFNDGACWLSWDESEDGDWNDITSGKVTVSKNGNEITINCTDENGKNITGFYKGPLIYYDYAWEQKSARIISKQRK